MNTRPRKHKLVAEINITPFTDVILVLLIIFMVTTPLIIQSNIKVNLPSSKSSTPVKDVSSQINITITAENLLYLDERLVTRKELKEQLFLRHRENPNLAAILAADKLTRYKDIVFVLDMLNAAGVKSLNIMTNKEQ